MPLTYARRMTGKVRTPDANRHLALALAFVAGATNAGGYMAVRQYTSHVTGVVSSMADDLVAWNAGHLSSAVGGLLSFLIGAASSAVLVNYARRRQLHSEYAFPLLLEAVVLLCFGLMGGHLSTIEGLFVPVTVMLLCFGMGLQNAVISKISRAELRTTHVTGLVTDMGIELGKLLYWNRTTTRPEVSADMARLSLLSMLLACFFAGGVVGALGFKYAGYVFTVPLAIVLVTLAAAPAIDDITVVTRRFRTR
jgi:uncharacterized membrane protein YoaK (UPF0700 family)